MKKFLLLSALMLAGCARLPQPSSTAAKQGDATFAKVADEYLTGYLAWRPQTGTTLGLHQYDGQVTDFSQASLNAELARLKTFERRLRALATTDLSPEASYDYRILRGAIKREIFGFEQMQIYSRNPMTYAGVLDVSIYIKRNFAPLEARVRWISAILNQAPNIFAAARANLADSLPRPQIETAIDQAKGAADFLSKDLVAALKDVKNETLMAEFNAANRRAIDELHGYVAYLKEQKLPKANESYALGRDNYIKLIEYGEMISLSPEQVLEIGLRELRRKQQVFAEAAKQIDPDKKPIEVFQAIQKDHPAEQSLIADTDRDMEMIRQFVIEHKIVTLPSPVRATVAETPQFLRATSFASMDTPGPFETKATEAYYYVTPVEPDWPPQQKEEWLTAFNYYTTDVVSIHEAYPGHYVQFLCLNASPASKVEKIFGSYAFVEGWAHYCEKMMLDEATKFFQENCYYEEKPARQEAMRGTFDPGYLNYTLGKLQILKLRDDYKAQEGDEFSLQKFHNELLNHGMPPVRLLREIMLKEQSKWGEVL